jgi:hypothetical protein
LDKPATLRSLAAKCRALADFTVSPNDKQVLRTAAEDFDAQAKAADRDSWRFGDD